MTDFKWDVDSLCYSSTSVTCLINPSALASRLSTIRDKITFFNCKQLWNRFLLDWILVLEAVSCDWFEWSLWFVLTTQLKKIKKSCSYYIWYNRHLLRCLFSQLLLLLSALLKRLNLFLRKVVLWRKSHLSYLSHFKT